LKHLRQGTVGPIDPGLAGRRHYAPGAGTTRLVEYCSRHPAADGLSLGAAGHRAGRRGECGALPQ
jgi:hypothetical protein